MMRSNLAGLCLLIALCGGVHRPLQAQFIHVPPVTYSGMVKDYMLAPFTGEHRASVYVRRLTADGALLARADTIDPLDGINYALAIPLVNVSNLVSTAATVGQQVRFDVDDGTMIWGNVSVQTIGNPGRYTLHITLMTDANGNGVADEYEMLIQALMDAYGITGAYDPNADYNGDGITNYQHYLSGTSPFAGKTPPDGSATGDSLTIESMMNVQVRNTADSFSISFRAIPDKLYSVLSIANLNAAWGAADMVDFSIAPGGEEQMFFTAEQSGLVTFYIRKDGSAARFYRLRME